MRAVINDTRALVEPVRRARSPMLRKRHVKPLKETFQMEQTDWNREVLGDIVGDLVKTYADEKGISHIDGLRLPDQQVILRCLWDIMFILYPGFTESQRVSHADLEYLVGERISRVFATLSEQVNISCRYRCRLRKEDATCCGTMGRDVAMTLLRKLPEIRETLKTDVQAHYDGDPAAESFDEIIMAYPGIRAISVHRIAHELYLCGVPLIPRILSEYIHRRTGIDIHPGARIGKSFFIDHGTGIVIGETTHIGENVKMYMGVTLGALAPAKGQKLRGSQRHPTVEDNVTIYSNATILGGDTVIGEGSVIGGNVWLTQSVPANTKVFISPPELVIVEKKA